MFMSHKKTKEKPHELNQLLWVYNHDDDRLIIFGRFYENLMHFWSKQR